MLCFIRSSNSGTPHCKAANKTYIKPKMLIAPHVELAERSQDALVKARLDGVRDLAKGGGIGVMALELDAVSPWGGGRCATWGVGTVTGRGRGRVGRAAGV